MKTIKYIVLLGLSTLMFSCVSSKKYSEAVSEKKDLQQKYADALRENERLKASANSEQVALNQREKALTDEEQKMKDMKALIDDERNAIINLKQEVCSAVKCFTPDELKIEIRDGKLYVSMSDKLLFASGSDALNKRGEEAIKTLATVLGNSKLEISVEGHTDPIPIHTARYEDNWDLSVDRATSVARVFIKDGITPERIMASGESKFHPIASNSTAQGRQLNRRTDIVLAPKLEKLWKLTEEPGITSYSTKKIF